ncbi:MAG: hypothetical protein V2J89_16450 [Halieaceae bacterium]|jgi:hypothetical protein|nr:hypothetical protein [Halieaceae bacterium]
MQIQLVRNARRSAALLMLLAGISHIVQLWFRETTGESLFTALTGAYFLMLALGLSGQSRFVLWLTSASVSLDVLLGAAASLHGSGPLQSWHIGLETAVVCLCVYVLFKTRFIDMD